MNSKDVSDNAKIALLLSTLWGYGMLTYFINKLVNLFVPYTPFDTIVCYSIVLIIIAYTSQAVLRRVNYIDILFILTCLISFLNATLLFPDNTREILNVLPRFCFTVLPFYLLGKAIDDFKLVLEYLRPVSMIVVFGALSSYVISAISEDLLIASSNMTFAYNLLPSVLLLLYFTFQNRSFLNFIVTIIGISVEIASGTRGPIGLIISFIAIYLLLTVKGVKRFLYSIFLFFIGVLISYSHVFITWIDLLNIKLVQLGINNRIIQKWLLGEIYDSSGRNVLQHTVADKLGEHPILGFGIMGDRIITQELFGVATYPHNFLLELWCHFGVVLGSLLMILLIIIVLKNLLSSNKYKKALVMIVTCLGLIKLFLSNSYVLEPYLFLLLGISTRDVLKDVDNVENHFLGDKT